MQNMLLAVSLVWVVVAGLSIASVVEKAMTNVNALSIAMEEVRCKVDRCN